MKTHTDQAKPRLSSTRSVPQWRVSVDGSRVFQVSGDMPLRVGSNPSNDLVLNDPTVSRMHAELSAEPSGVAVRDLGSTNGTWWKGLRITDAVIPSGVILFGGSKLTVSSDAEAVEALSEVTEFGPLVGQSAPMRALFKTLSRVSPTSSTVLIQAESGSGKELVARAMHEASPRKSSPYVVFDCAAAAPSLIESALFGHERGAFTGALRRKLGCFEEAEGGTLFLDEIGELPIELQPRLLRALETKQIRRVGAEKPIAIDVRLVAATHRDLARQVNQGQFREDLYYRLAVVRLRIPPLREWLDDLRMLVEHLMSQALNGNRDKAEVLVSAISDAQWSTLRKHPWRGNVRELRNAVERSLAMSDALSPSSDFEPLTESLSDPAALVSFDQPFLDQKRRLVERFESQYLRAMVERHGGNLKRAAADAGIDRMYFKRLLRKYATGSVF